VVKTNGKGGKKFQLQRNKQIQIKTGVRKTSRWEIGKGLRQENPKQDETKIRVGKDVRGLLALRREKVDDASGLPVESLRSLKGAHGKVQKGETTKKREGK